MQQRERNCKQRWRVDVFTATVNSQIICGGRFDRRPGEGSRRARSRRPRCRVPPPAADQFDDAIERRRSIVRDVERDLHAVARRAEAQARASVRKPPSRSRTARAIARGRARGRRLASSTLNAIKMFARADRNRSGARVPRDVALVGQPIERCAESPAGAGAPACARPHRNKRKECDSARQISAAARGAPARLRPRASRRASGTNGSTSSAPMRGCTPRWQRRSMRSSGDAGERDGGLDDLRSPSPTIVRTLR